MNANRKSANKRNASRSTGPRTEAGKARSRLNATKHGGYSKVALDGEDRGRLKALYLEMLAEYRPVGFEENLLITEITETIWRKNRFKVAEARAIDLYSYVTFGGEERKADVGLALAQDAGAYGTIPRCLGAEDILDRRLWRLFDRLRELQKKRGFYPWKSTGSNTGTVIGGIQPDESLASPASSSTSVLVAVPATLDCD